ncbi:hypothetical protein KI688_001669 [Linnemannia hyalina]|uniref:RRM domain-containing protein n=1 Tax=Linnemannia hyalina TaxID=64524 RepID=A0A9P8BSN7_9FUNG|nr:hypothetical protein KI688_001669 [Linnemannia hyalina]
MDDSYDQIMDDVDDHGLTANQGANIDILEEEDTHPRRSSYHHSHDDAGRRRGDENSGSDRDRERDSRGDDYHRRRRDSRDYGSSGTPGASGADATAAVVAGGASKSAGGRSRSRSPAGGQHHEDSYRGEHRAYETTSGSRDDKYETDRGERRGSDYERAPRGGRSRSRSPVGTTSSGRVAPGFLRERRVYVGNLSYDVAWTDLKDFMREVGPVAHADVLLGPDGKSKGCGVVEFQTAEDAKTAIRKMNDVVLRGRPVFVREDRESGERIGASGGRAQSSRSADVAIRQVFVGNLPFSVHWKDLKDMFRRAGPVDRADVFMNGDMRSKGSGIVLFERTSDVQRAICDGTGPMRRNRRSHREFWKHPDNEALLTFAETSHGKEDQHQYADTCSQLRADKFGPQAGSRSSHRGDDYRPSHGGYSESRESRDRGYGSTTSSSRYDDYRRESSSGRSRDYYDSGSHGHSSSSRSGRHDDMSMASVPSGPAAGSGDRIYVRNLPFTTTNQDLRDLFRICGSIRSADVLMQDGRAKGSGVVRFESFESADKAVAKFNGYSYGGRSLEITYDR